MTTKTRNPRPYRKDDSYHNAVGTVGGAAAGLLGVVLALAGTAALGTSALGGVGSTLMLTCYTVESPKTCTEYREIGGPLLLISAFLFLVGAGKLGAAALIFRNYNK